LRPPSSHTTVRTVPYTAVRDVLRITRDQLNGNTSQTPPRPTTASISPSPSPQSLPLLAVTLDAPLPVPRDFRPLPPGPASDISVIVFSVSLASEIQDDCIYSTFGPSEPSACLPMASADFCQPFP